MTIVVKQQRDEDLDSRPPPWAVVVKIEKPPASGWRGSAVAPGLLAPEDIKPMVVPVYKEDTKPWADEKKPVTRDFKVKPLPTTNPLNLLRDAAHVPPKPKTDPDAAPKTDPDAKPKMDPDAKPKTSPPQEDHVETIMLPPTNENGVWRERVCAQNYAAMDAESGAYGLIGVEASALGGVRSLVMHVPRKHRADRVLTQVRPGSILKVRRKKSRGQPDPPIQELRVRFTTPARYYGPGRHVTTLGIGVDEAEWLDVLLG